MVEGEDGSEMFILVKGIAVVTKFAPDLCKETRLATLRAGDVFGEAAPLTGAKRSASVIAVTFCDMLVLSKQHFDEVMELWPHFYDSVIQNAENKATDAKKERAQKGWGAAKETIGMVKAVSLFAQGLSPKKRETLMNPPAVQLAGVELSGSPKRQQMVPEASVKLDAVPQNNAVLDRVKAS